MKLPGMSDLTSRDVLFGVGWGLLAVGCALWFSFAVGCVVGGACLFLTAVFGIAPSKGA